MGFPRVDLTKREYGRLRVQGFAGRDSGRRALWNCLCKCGKMVVVAGYSLTKGFSRSCGCLQIELLTTRKTTHGESGGARAKRTPEYRTWAHILTRCYDDSCQEYSLYGGRGIRVCYRWRSKNGYVNFLKDMGRRPGPGYSIDRKNNKLWYTKNNCRWATMREQQNNRGNNHRVRIGRLVKTIAQWAEEVGIGPSTIRWRLSQGWSARRALYTPVRSR